MIEYTEQLQTKNYSKDIKWRAIMIKKPEFIIIHSTGTPLWTTKGNLNVLIWNTDRDVSAHFLISEFWEIYKLSNLRYMTWHCWLSCWGIKTSMNKYSIWIELVWWVWDLFPQKQRQAVRDLINQLMKDFKIPKENILRHSDITNENAKFKILWDWKSKNRKTDVNHKFWDHWFFSWKDYQDSYSGKSIFWV
jgi:N-acetyl-anhydromuramyl-L-alanine amidase AmpD